jgi:translation initiation factor 1 (eIF-1/SUI1)
MGTVLQFQGDQRDAMMAFLLENEIAEKSMIKKHGHG